MNSVCSIKYKLLAFYYAADTEYEYLVTVSDQLLSKVRCSDNFLRVFAGNSNFHDWLNFYLVLLYLPGRECEVILSVILKYSVG